MVTRIEPRVVKAGNSGPFTLDGTRTYLVGEEEVAVIDPGPDEEEHVRALSHSLQGARVVKVLLTHAHRDHGGAARALSERLAVSVLGPPSAGARFFPEEGERGGSPQEGTPGFRALREGDVVSTDQGSLVVMETPGHTADHLSFRWPAAGAVFVGDLLLGRGATTWLGEYAGCVGDYLASLRRVRAVGPGILYPSHGPPITSPENTLDRFDSHRRKRLAQVEEAQRVHPLATPDELVSLVYGAGLEGGVLLAARASVEVMLHHLRGDGPPE